MAGPVAYKAYEAAVGQLLRIAEQAAVLLVAAAQVGHLIDNHFYDVDILLLVEAAYVVSLAEPAVQQHGVDSRAVVGYIEPIAYVAAVAIHRQRLALEYIIYHQRYQFLRKLIWAVVVAAAGNKCRESVSVYVRQHQHVG